MSESTPAFKPGGGVPDGPLYVDRRNFKPVMTTEEANEFLRHMAAQDPMRLKQNRAEAWGHSIDPRPLPADAMVVTFDRAPRK
ncbi:hypothetical protein ACFT7U_11540 [Streptomyces rochei]|uniref:hypothetical protein n=1 Tax=Streptomyces rochei TaxID=1928 RepID=UPI00363D39F9